MNELSNIADQTAKIRKTLLTTASALALAAYSGNAQAVDNDRPTLWIEGGWHFENVTDEGDLLVAPLDGYTRATGLPSFETIEKALGKTYGGEGSISFQPKGSGWVFTASARYGRVQTVRRVLDQKVIVGPQMLHYEFPPSGGFLNVPFTPTRNAYAAGDARNSESHTTVDFQVGKDVGIGLLGGGTESIISFGAKYAQMSTRSKAHSYANPDAAFVQTVFFGKYRIQTINHRSSTFVERTDNFHAVGPSLSLKNTTGLLGTTDDGQLALDWGVNAALLFGRQKAENTHSSTVRYFRAGGAGQTHYVQPPVTHSRSHMVTVPNVGGFAGLSYRFPNAKLSAGYRADFFFGARDGGMETRSTTNVGFHGPYAAISIGLGG